MDDVLDLLGLIYRARKMVLGDEILKRIRDVKLLVLADDISEKSRERFAKKCRYYSIDIIGGYDGRQLSSALGKSNVKAIGIIDDGFCRALKEKMD